MGRCLLKVADDEYLEWSSVVDAPVSYLQNRSEAVKEHGEERVARADERGHSYVDMKPGVHRVLACNRAGENETELTLEEIREAYRARGDCPTDQGGSP